MSDYPLDPESSFGKNPHTPPRILGKPLNATARGERQYLHDSQFGFAGGKRSCLACGTPTDSSIHPRCENSDCPAKKQADAD